MAHNSKSRQRSLLVALGLLLSACSSDGIIAPDDDYIVVTDEQQEARPRR